MDRRTWIRAGAATLAGTALPLHAQDRNPVVRIVVPYVAGGQTDLLARTMLPILSRELGRTVIVENKPGAAALIATQYVQNAAPDGTTLLFHNSGFVALPMMSKTAKYDAIKDFVGIARVGIGPNFLVINGNVPAKTTAEFIAWAKAQPDGVTAANSGVNSGGHLGAQLFAKRAGIKVLHVPYKGSAETANAVITGEVTFQMTSPIEVLTQQAKLGRVRFLGVATREKSQLAPDLPLLSETVPNFAYEGWFGILAPAGTPAEIAQKASAAFRAALADREVRDRFLQLYMDPAYQDPRQFAAEIAESAEYWRGVIRELELQPT